MGSWLSETRPALARRGVGEVFGLVVDVGANGALRYTVGESVVDFHEGLSTLKLYIFAYVFAVNF